MQRKPSKKVERFVQEQESIQDLNQFSSIVHALQSASANARKEAARKLGDLGLDVAVEPLLLAFLSEEEIPVRIQIIESLAEIGTDEAIAGIMDTLNDPYSEVREAAIDALRDNDSDEVIEALFYTAEDDVERSVRLAAINALFEYKEPQIIEELSELLSDPDPMIRNAIKRGIGR
jgi:HEAT repeat protein